MISFPKTNAINKINDMIYNKNKNVSNIILSNENVKIVKIVDQRSSMNYIFLTATLDNGYLLYIRIPIESIQESVRISNSFLYTIAFIIIIILMKMLKDIWVRMINKLDG